MGGDKVDAGTLSYMAPECLERVAAETTPAIDVWAIGVMFFAMLYGQLPFDGSTEKELINSIKNDTVKFPTHVPVTDIGKDCIKQFLNKDHTKRLSLLEFMEQHPYANIDEEDLEAKVKEVVQKHELIVQKQQEEELKLQESLQKMELGDEKISSKKEKEGGHKKKKAKKKIAH